MKAINTTAANKLSVRFDKELMNLLMTDLKVRKAKNQLANNQLKAA
jgi:hypothetical protein